MNESMHIPDELRPIEPQGPEKRQTAAPAPEPVAPLEPFSASHDRPPLPS
jgi:hypothetical protein